MLVGLVIMVIEWLISCYVVLKVKPVQKQPKTFGEAMKYRWKRLKVDLIRQFMCGKMSKYKCRWRFDASRCIGR